MVCGSFTVSKKFSALKVPMRRLCATVGGAGTDDRDDGGDRGVRRRHGGIVPQPVPVLSIGSVWYKELMAVLLSVLVVAVAATSLPACSLALVRRRARAVR